MTMGAGMIKQQGPTLIRKLIQSGDFFKIPVLSKIITNCLSHDTPLHLLGLLSDGNIHSHVDHMQAIIRHAFQAGIRRCYVHALLDGRDVGVQSALTYTEPFEKLFENLRSSVQKLIMLSPVEAEEKLLPWTVTITGKKWRQDGIFMCRENQKTVSPASRMQLNISGSKVRV